MFDIASGWLGAAAASPRRLLAWVVVLSGGLSAWLLNDTVVLVLTPLVPWSA